MHITTADYDRPSPCNEKYTYAKAVMKGSTRTGLRRGGIRDRAFLPIVFEAEPDDDWTDPRVWERANPNLDVSVSREYLEREVSIARVTPRYEFTFRRLHLNQRTRQDVRWLDPAAWDKCRGDPPETWDLGDRPCWGGLDLASNRDANALVLFFPDTRNEWNGVGRVLPFFWVPEEQIRTRMIQGDDRYQDWHAQGFLETTPEDTADFDLIRARINALGEVFNVVELAVDRYNAHQLMMQLDSDGFEVVPFSQQMKPMSGPMKHVERLISRRGFWHGGHPVLSWMARNVVAKTDSFDNCRPVKSSPDSKEHIDGMVSLIMAVGVWGAGTGDDGTSIYETRGIVSLADEPDESED